jgi:hypothetical protein
VSLGAVPTPEEEGDGSDAGAREQALRACHQRSADKLLKLCFDNGGIYIKLGQHIGQLVSVCGEAAAALAGTLVVQHAGAAAVGSFETPALDAHTHLHQPHVVGAPPITPAGPPAA